MATKAHSHIGGSSAHRWMECPGSPRLIAKAPPQEPSIFINEGVAAHELLEICLNREEHPDNFIGEVMKNGIEITAEITESVSTCLDYISQLRSEGKFIQLIEAKFDLSNIHEGLFGTADVVLVRSDTKELHVIDYKHGAGVPVNVVENEQLLYYVLGAVNYCHKEKKWLDDPMLFGWHQSFEKIVVHIVQPRCRHKDGIARLWQLEPGRLDKFADQLKDAAVKTESKDAPLISGPHCKFCPAMPICPAFGQSMTELAVADFKDFTPGKTPVLPSPDTMSKEQIVKVLSLADLFSDWLKSIEKYAFQMAEQGEKIPGFKLVKKKSNRVWIDEAEAADKLGLLLSDDEIWEKSVRSPAQIEKLVGKKNKKMIEDLYHQPDTGNTLAPESDPRPEIQNSITQDFIALE